MKTFTKTLSLAIIASITLFGCSKNGSSDNGTKPLTATTWTFGGKTFKGTYTGITDGALIAVDNALNPIPNIEIDFSSQPAAGTYTVLNGVTYGGNLTSKQCLVGISDSNGGSSYYSISGGTVTVTINNGKVNASFTNIAMGSVSGTNNAGTPTFTAAGTTSGTLVEQ